MKQESVRESITQGDTVRGGGERKLKKIRRRWDRKGETRRKRNMGDVRTMWWKREVKKKRRARQRGSRGRRKMRNSRNRVGGKGGRKRVCLWGGGVEKCKKIGTGGGYALTHLASEPESVQSHSSVLPLLLLLGPQGDSSTSTLLLTVYSHRWPAILYNTHKNTDTLTHTQAFSMHMYGDYCRHKVCIPATTKSTYMSIYNLYTIPVQSLAVIV